ncbi:MAG TPA: M20/M25/M40 family metallo-hydrolase [Dongiaceae bacterium]|nr:M20/M25/M40 family metallo-hydrolase [Dongiaceae bacterium]
MNTTLAGLSLAACAVLVAWPGRCAESNPAEKSAGETDAIARIREEGLERSQVMETLSWLCDVIGPRLTGSPNLKRANQWTRDRMAGWGLTNAHLEAWGPFGRGWTLKRFSAQVIEPQTIPLLGCAAAWSPGLDKPVVADVVYLDPGTNTDFKMYEGKLKGAIVLAGQPRELGQGFEPLATRITETNLLQLANASADRAVRYSFSMGSRATTRRPAPGRFGNASRALSFLAKEGVALVVNPSMMGEGGTLLVASASVPGNDGPRTNRPAGSPRAWSTNAPAMPPQVTLAAEDYNRLVRMLQKGEKLKMAVDLEVQFNDDDLMAYNTIAEIPGSDLKDEIVMLGGHLDSWHAGTGATDNGAGAVAAMEAVRIIAALKLQPRRTIRVALWSGEEQGLLGSKAYVARHFGYYTNIVTTNAATTNLAATNLESTNPAGAGEVFVSTLSTVYNVGKTDAEATNRAPVEALRSPKDSTRPHPISMGEYPRPSWLSSSNRDPAGARPARSGSSANSSSTRKLVRLEEYEKLSVYFNLDNGAGKIRGIYMQNNEAVRPQFRAWLEPFRDLGAETLTPSNTGGTDHLSFDEIGLPAFEFMQDPLDYGTRTHHTNQDLVDRVLPDDLKQAAVILAAFVYDAAMAEAKLPRKPSPQRP